MTGNEINVALALAEISDGIMGCIAGDMTDAHYAIGVGPRLVHVFVVRDEDADAFGAAYRALPEPAGRDTWHTTDGSPEGAEMMARAREVSGA